MVASPLTIDVPANNELKASEGAAASHEPARFSVGNGSPVISASLRWAIRLSSTTPSAGTRSPALSSTTSPGTTCSTGIETILPSRRTSAWMATERFSASAASSARCSCTTSNMIDNAMTMTMMQKLAISPVNPEMAAATIKIAMRGSANLLAIFKSSRRCGVAATELGPKRASRCPASIEVSPAVLPSTWSQSVLSGRRQN